MSDRENYNTFLFGCILGGFVGAVLALIFAPRSGLETRSMIRDRYIELQERIIHTAREELAEEASEPTSTGGGRPGAESEPTSPGGERPGEA